MKNDQKTNRKKTDLGADLTASHHLAETHDAKLAKSLIWLIGLALLTFIYWSALTPVYEVVSGKGSIKPDGLTTRIEHLEGGIATQVLVEVGDKVEENQLLVKLDDKLLLSELQKLAARQNHLERNIARFRSLIAADLLGGDYANVQTDWIEGPSPFLVDIGYRLAQIDTIQRQIAVVEAQRAALIQSASVAQKELKIQKEQLQRYLDLGDAASVSRNKLDELRREALRLEASSSQMSGEIAVQSATINQMEASQRELVAQFRREASLQLEEQLAEILAIKETVGQVEKRIERTEIRATIAGEVNTISILDVGEVIAPSELIAEIVPTENGTFAEIEIAADRIGKLSVGSAASLKILTYDFTRYGDVDAFVRHISPTSFKRENGESYFRVQLSYNERVVGGGKGQSDQVIKPGLTVSADVKSDRRTILSFLLKPIRVIADRALTEA